MTSHASQKIRPQVFRLPNFFFSYNKACRVVLCRQLSTPQSATYKFNYVWGDFGRTYSDFQLSVRYPIVLRMHKTLIAGDKKNYSRVALYCVSRATLRASLCLIKHPLRVVIVLQGDLRVRNSFILERTMIFAPCLPTYKYQYFVNGIPSCRCLLVPNKAAPTKGVARWTAPRICLQLVLLVRLATKCAPLPASWPVRNSQKKITYTLRLTGLLRGASSCILLRGDKHALNIS